MAFDPGLAQIFEDDLSDHSGISSCKMFGGLCFQHNGHMICGVHKSKDKQSDMAMFRVGPELYEAALELKGVSELSFTGRPMKGMVETDDRVFDDDELRAKLIEMALTFTSGLPPK